MLHLFQIGREKKSFDYYLLIICIQLNFNFLQVISTFCSFPDRAVRARGLAGDTVLCSWARHTTLTVPLSTQEYKWVPSNCWGNPSRGSRNTPNRFMLQKPGYAPAAMSQSWLQGFPFFNFLYCLGSGLGLKSCYCSYSHQSLTERVLDLTP